MLFLSRIYLFTLGLQIIAWPASAATAIAAETECQPDGDYRDEIYVTQDSFANDGPNTGVKSQPFATITKGLSVLTPGKRLCIGAGVYDESISIKRLKCLSGIQPLPAECASNTRIKVIAFGNDRVIIQPKTIPLPPLQMSNLSSTIPAPGYLTFKNLIFDAAYSNSSGVTLDHEISSHHIDIEGGEIRFAVDHGIVGSCDQCKFSNIKIHDNGLGSGLHGIYLYGDRSTVNGCQIYRNSDKAFRNGNAMNLTFSNNMIFENGRIRPNGYSVEAGRMDGRFTNNVFAQNRNGGLWIFGSTIASGNTFRDNSGRGLEITYAEDSKLFTDKTYYSNVLSNVFKNNGFLNGLSDLKIGQEAFPLDENCEPKEPRAPREPIELNSLIQNNRFIGASTLENKNCFNVPTGTILGAPWLLSYDKGIVIPADIRVNGLVSPYQSYLLDTYDDENSISVSKPFELSFTQPIGNHSTEWLILAEPLVKPGEGSVQPTVNPSFSRITHNPTDPDTAMIEFKRPGAYLMRVLVKKLSDGTMLSQVFGVNFIPKSTKVAGFDRIRLQAEHMQTAHFEIAPSSKFSSGDYIQTTGETGESHDEVYSIFPGDDGLYKVNIGYFDIGCVDALGLRANCTKDHERAKGRLNFLRFRGELTPSNRSFNWVLDADAGSVLGDQPGRQNRELGFVNLKKGDWIGIDGFDTSNGYKFDNSTPPKKITIEKFNLDYIDLIKQP